MRHRYATLAAFALCGCVSAEASPGVEAWSPSLAIVAEPAVEAEPEERAVDVPQPPACAPVEPLNVLFIGNSYVIQSDTPALLEAMAVDAGVEFHVERLAMGGKDFAFHLGRSQTTKMLAAREWDVVLLQSHSLDPLRDPEGFVNAGAGLVKAVRASGAEPMLFETWPRRAGHNLYNYMEEVGKTPAEMLGRVAAQYAQLGQQTGTPVVPVGHAWMQLQDEHAEVGLYLKDGAHPAEAGAYLSAAVIFAELTERDPRSVLRPHGAVDATKAAVLGAVAASVVEPPCTW